MYRICFVIYSGLTAAKVQLFCDICKRKMHFLSEKAKNLPKIERIYEGKASQIPTKQAK